MPFIYKSYCYETLPEVSDLIQSQVDIGGGILVVSATPNVTDIDMVIRDGLLSRTFTMKFTPPSCTDLGFQGSYSGLTLQDSIEMSSITLLAFALVYAIKSMRRSAK